MPAPKLVVSTLGAKGGRWEAAEGRTNREIAYQLYVTLKTIEGHLARAYTKLDIERRHQLSKFFDGTKTRVPTP